MTNPVFPILTERPDTKLYGVEFEDQSTGSKMDGGYVVTRPKHTRSPRRTFSTGYTMLKPIDRAALDTFYRTVFGGSVIFDWIDPMTSVVYQVRFTSKLAYKYSGVGTTQRWDISFTLEQA